MPDYAAVFALTTKLPPINLLNVDQIAILLWTAQMLAAES